MRTQDFNARLEKAKQAPDLRLALLRLGFGLKRTGHSSRYGSTEYRLTTERGVAGDYSALSLCECTGGGWVVFDNKQRYGRLTYDAIGCLCAFFDHSFDEAVYALTGNGTVTDVPTKAERQPPRAADSKPFALPPPVEGRYRRLYAYLLSRGISAGLITALVHERLLYEAVYSSPSGEKTVAVFPIYTPAGEAVGADSCGTYSELRFKHLYRGSDPRYGWHFKRGDSADMYFCESAIDAMSLYLLTGADGMYISMCGLKDITYNGMLTAFGGTPIICADNDEAGDKFRARHKAAVLLPTHKDWNDDLKALKGDKAQ